MKYHDETILVIDDDVAVRQSFSYFLEDLDYRVLSAENGRDGLRIFEEEKADMVLVDLRMPVLSGWEVITELASNSPNTPLIVISGTRTIKDVVGAVHLGAWDYLVKPLDDFAVLHRAVENGFEKARLKKKTFIKELQKNLKNEFFDDSIIPICSFCKKIRDRDGGWETVEWYLEKCTKCKVSHGICPDCIVNHYEEFFD